LKRGGDKERRGRTVFVLQKWEEEERWGHAFVFRGYEGHRGTGEEIKKRFQRKSMAKNKGRKIGGKEKYYGSRDKLET